MTGRSGKQQITDLIGLIKGNKKIDDNRIVDTNPPPPPAPEPSRTTEIDLDVDIRER